MADVEDDITDKTQSSPKHHPRTEGDTKDKRLSSPEHHPRTEGDTKGETITSPEHHPLTEGDTKGETLTSPEHHPRTEGDTKGETLTSPEHHPRTEGETLTSPEHHPRTEGDTKGETLTSPEHHPRTEGDTNGETLTSPEHHPHTESDTDSEGEDIMLTSPEHQPPIEGDTDSEGEDIMLTSPEHQPPIEGDTDSEGEDIMLTSPEHQPPIVEEIAPMLPDIDEYLGGSKVLVTGVTGFVGITLVEKLLRCVSDIGTIYVLIRPKRGKGKDERLKEIVANPIFDTIRNSDDRAILKKIVALEGNIDAKDLDLNDYDLQSVIYQVHYVFHCAATLDFEASLKTTVEINVLGTRRVVELCKRMQSLKCLVHVSSAYSNADKLEVEEKLYPPPEDVEKVIKMVQTMSGTSLDEITPQVLKDHPNTYTFTKALAEHEVAKNFKQAPSCIVRPSMIVGTWREPVPGWTNSKNGPQGFIMGAAMGVVRRLPVGKHLIYDYIPVDTVVNTMIAAAVFTASESKHLKKIPIFHCTTSTYKPFRWADVEEKVSDLLHKYPLMQAVWYPHLKLLPSIWRYRISAFIFHMIPAYFFDTLAKYMGGRPRLVKLHSNINQSLDRLAPFIFTEWKFDNSAALRLHQCLTPQDKETFCLDVGSLEWDPFFDDMAKGVRKYLHKEEDRTLAKARKKNQKLRLANFILQVALLALLWVLIKYLGDFSWGQASSIVPLFYIVYLNL